MLAVVQGEMTRDRYEAPGTIKEAAGLLAKSKGSAFVLAGGSDLLVRMKGGLVEPDLIVDIKGIVARCEITGYGSGFRIGAAVSSAPLGEDAALAKAWPGVVEAANLIGSKQVQGRCTIAGNLCNASPAADSVPALVAAGARAVVVGPRGRRTMPVEQMATGPGKTSLKKGEIIEAILLPKRRRSRADAYLRFIPRTEMDIAVVSAGVCLTLGAKGVVKAARIALGAVAPTVFGRGSRRGRSSARSSTNRRWRGSQRPARPPASRSTTSGARSNSEPRWPACWPAVPPGSPTSAQEGE